LISSENPEFLLKGFISHDCHFEGWADLEGTITQRNCWETLDVDDVVTQFNA
jgi:hypothetical protein